MLQRQKFSITQEKVQCFRGNSLVLQRQKFSITQEKDGMWKDQVIIVIKQEQDKLLCSC